MNTQHSRKTFFSKLLGLVAVGGLASRSLARTESPSAPIPAGAPSGIVPYEIAEMIRMKKAQYCRFVDNKRFRDLQSIVWPDASFTFTEPGGSAGSTINTQASFIERVSDYFKGARSSHRVTNSELRQLSENQVEAIWAMDDYIVFPLKEGELAPTMHRYGHYHELWEQRNGEWKMRSLRLSRAIVDHT